ncbi:MAG: hypothetical protein IPM49_00630 [Flavobacteriales bacterium]|nr:hypothetical protein [Flavobacteriales bacterium]
MTLDEAVAKLEEIAKAERYNKEAVKRQLLAKGFHKVGRSLLGCKNEQGDLVAVFTLVDSKKSTSNTITSLKNILKHDELPFVAVFLDKSAVRFKLANSSLIKKASHSSQGITLERIKGSINGGDILNTLGDVLNEHAHLAELFAQHKDEDHAEHRERIVEATQAIKGRAPATPPDWDAVEENLRDGSGLLDKAILEEIRRTLFDRVASMRQAILACASHTSPKAFGDCVERMILSTDPAHALGDILFANGRVAVDIKGRKAGVPSSPKAFNVQKLVDHLSKGPGAALFFTVTVDVQAGTVACTLIHMLHPELMKHYWHDVRWSGRGSLGTLSLKGDLSAVLNTTERLDLDAPAAITRLRELLGEEPGA